MMGYDLAAGGSWLWMLGGLLLVIGIIVLVVWVGTRASRPGETPAPGPSGPTPNQILSERFARGEITEQVPTLPTYSPTQTLQAQAFLTADHRRRPRLKSHCGNTEDRSMSTPLQGKVAFVTGASKGIGAAVARALSAQGVKQGLASRGGGTGDDIAEAVTFVLTRPRTFRVLEIAMRHMSEQSWG